MSIKSIGIVGNGQLGFFIGIEALKLGLKPVFFHDKTSDTCQNIGENFIAKYDDEARITEFLKSVDVVTCEYEDIPDSFLDLMQSYPEKFFPSVAFIKISKDRFLEKQTLQNYGLKTARFWEMNEALVSNTEIKYPVILKTRFSGYDGKGQVRVKDPNDLLDAWKQIENQPAIVEECVKFEFESSAVMAVSKDAKVVFYQAMQNHHEAGILRRSFTPENPITIPDSVKNALIKMAGDFNYRGVICVEFFVCKDGWIANEIAPRVHNSGHWSLDFAISSQFENHLRAVCGLKLGSVDSIAKYFSMFNVISSWPQEKLTLLNFAELKIYDYNKSPRSGRKLGHLNFATTQYEEFVQKSSQIKSLLE